MEIVVSAVLSCQNSAARQSLDRLRILLRHGTQRLRQADEVAGRSPECEHPAHPSGAAEAGLALPAQHQTTLSRTRVPRKIRLPQLRLSSAFWNLDLSRRNTGPYLRSCYAFR